VIWEVFVRKVTVGLLSLVLIPGTGVLAASSATGAPARAPAQQAKAAPTGDDLLNPLETQRRAARTTAVNDVISGTATPEKRGASTVVKVGKKTKPGVRPSAATSSTVDQYVELSREKTDKIFVVLAEFGNQRHPDYPDQDTDPNTPGPVRFDGPLHNQIPAPDRTQDQATVWQADYNRQHYQDMYFGAGPGVDSLKTFYEKQSSGRYSVDGVVTDWVTVPFNEARYGRSNGFPCASIVCSNSWFLIKDALDSWVAGQHAQGWTDQQIHDELTSLDQWDRYDFDGDGNFNEPDGYLDHFQIVHAGGDQADGDPYQGEDAIWSHRSYAFSNTAGHDGPANNPLGGVQIGNTGLWVGDYTMQPENGGVSVFAHEYGHDLGLPDEYDTTGVTGNAEGPVNWWTIMSQSRLSAAGAQDIGSKPPDFGPWDKLQLGWLDYEVVKVGQKKTLDLGPAEYNSAKPQAAVVVLPPKTVTTPLPTPPEGAKQWWSGKGDALNNTLTRQVTIPAGTATLSFSANWDIEDCGSDPCDYAYVEVNDGGANGFVALPGSITNPAEGNGIDGKSNGWKAATFDLSAYAGKTVSLRFRYATDTAAGGIGFFADGIKLVSGTTTVFADGAESGLNGWTANGFSAVGASLTQSFANYYIAANRSYISYDQYLQTGPYQFGWVNTQLKRVEHFPYQTGVQIWYWDTSFSDNNTSVHFGGGLILPVDAHPDLVYRLDGQPWRPRIQGYDSPFSLAKADSFTLHNNGAASYIRGKAGVPLFDDSRSYYAEDNAANVHYGVKVPNDGVKIRVVSQDGTSARIRVNSD
jgi:immune inhibitor A